jgi:hypothetical protein
VGAGFSPHNNNKIVQAKARTHLKMFEIGNYFWSGGVGAEAPTHMLFV